MVVYGGYGNAGRPDDLPALSLAGTPAWTDVTASGPEPSLRDGHAAIYDAPNNRMVIYAGVDDPFGTAWAVTLSGGPAWSTLAPVGIPNNPYRSSVVYDSQRDRLLVLNDANTIRIWAHALGGEPAWSEILPGGTAPPSRSLYSAIYDPIRDRVLIYGGYYANDVWALNLSGGGTWTEIVPSGTAPSQRQHHTAIYDPLRDRMIVYGGQSENDCLTDVWALSFAGGPAWSQLVPGGGPPVGRAGHTAIYDSDRDEMVVFGGNDGFGTFRHDVWALSITGTPRGRRSFPP